MIFKSLHNKLLNKKIKKSLNKLTLEERIKPNPIKTLACIIDPSFPISVENFIDLSASLGLKEKDLKIITFQENKNIGEEELIPDAEKNDFGIFALILDVVERFRGILDA